MEQFGQSTITICDWNGHRVASESKRFPIKAKYPNGISDAIKAFERSTAERLMAGRSSLEFRIHVEQR